MSVIAAVAAVLPESGGLDRQREGGEPRAAKGAGLRPAARGEASARDAAPDHWIPHVVRGTRLRPARGDAHSMASRRGARQMPFFPAPSAHHAGRPGGARTFATKHSETEKSPPITPKFLPHAVSYTHLTLPTTPYV